MTNFRKTLLAGTALVAVAAFAAPGQALAACPTAALIAANCELQSNTAGAITLADGVDVTLDTTGVVIGHTIDHADATADSTIVTSGTVTISQTAAIGANDEIGSLTIAAGGTWTSQASIETTLGTTVNGTWTIDAAGASVFTNDAGGIEIGATGLVTIADSTTGTVQFGDAQGIDIATGGELVIDDATGLTLWVVDGNAAGQGTVTFNDSFTLTHALGTTALAAIDIAAGETLAAGANNVSATDISVGAGGALTLSTATVTGDVSLGAGASMTVSGAGTVTGDITGSTGAETLTLSGAAVSIGGATYDVDLGSGNDTVAITGAATIDADTLVGGSGTDAITLNGAAATIASDVSGFETITVSSGNILTLTGDVTGAAISLAATNAQITYNATGETLAGTVTGDGNVNKFTLTDGTVSATVDMAGGIDVVDVNGGTISGTFSTGAGADMVTLAGATISGTLDGGTAIEDNISVDGSVTVSGTIQDVEAITFTDANQTLTVSGTGSLVTDGDGSDIDLLVGAGGEILTFSGTSSYTGEIVGDAADTVNFGGTSHTTGGQIETVIVNVTAGTLTVDDILGGGAALADFNVSAGAEVDTSANITTSGDLANAGTVDISSGSTVQAATYDSTVAGTWVLGVKRTGGTTNVGGMTLTGEAVDINLDTVEIVIEAGSQALVAGTYDAFLGAAGGATMPTADVVENSFFYNFALAEDDVNGDVDLVVTESTSLETAAGTGNNYAGGTVLLSDLAGSTDTEVNLAQANLAAAASEETFQETLESTLPTVDAGFVTSTLSVGNQVAGITETRLASLRSGEAQTGMAAGNMSTGLKGWGQAFGKTADQDARDGVDGYDADTYGFAVGLDTENLAANTVLGVALSYGNTDVDSKNATRTKSDIDTYQVTLYGSHDLDPRTYISGQLAYANNNIDQTRHDVGMIAGLNADADFDSDQYTVRTEMGRDYETNGGVTLTPSVMAHYTHVSIDSYSETGAGGLSQSVDNDDLDVFELGLGLDAAWIHQNDDGSYLKPVLSAGYRYDLIGDEVETTSTFAAGGPAFKTTGFDPAQHTFDVGAGLTYYSTMNWELSANYDFEYKSDYDAHSGYLRAAYKF